MNRTFRREIHRPSAPQLWQIPDGAEFPTVSPAFFFRRLPLETQETSYLALAERIRSFSRTGRSWVVMLHYTPFDAGLEE